MRAAAVHAHRQLAEEAEALRAVRDFARESRRPRFVETARGHGLGAGCRPTCFPDEHGAVEGALNIYSGGRTD